MRNTDDGGDTVVSGDLDTASSYEVEHVVQIAFVQKYVTRR